MMDRIEVTIKMTIDGSKATTIREDDLDDDYSFALGQLISDCIDSCSIPAKNYEILANAVFCADDTLLFTEEGKDMELNALADISNNALSDFLKSANEYLQSEKAYRKCLFSKIRKEEEVLV